MRIGLAQIDCKIGDIETNCAKILKLIGQAREKTCEVVVFPEASDTGYVPSVIHRVARRWSEEPFVSIQKSAKENSISVICGLSEREGDQVYNSLAVISPEGKLLTKYRKTHLFSPAPACEDRHFIQGSEVVLAELGGLLWGFSICYDLRFPELYRSMTLQGAEVLVNSAAWPASRSMHWDCLTRARAIENQAYLIGVSRIGTDDEFTFSGRSRIIEPTGDILVEGSERSEMLVVGEIDPRKIVDCRNSIPVFKSRRSDIYGDLSGPPTALEPIAEAVTFRYNQARGKKI